MNLQTLATRIAADLPKQNGIANIISDGATYMRGGDYADITAFVPPRSLADARALAAQLQAAPLVLNEAREGVPFAPADLGHDAAVVTAAGNSFLELVEATRYLHFWTQTLCHRVHVIVEVTGTDGPKMQVDPRHVPYQNSLVERFVQALSDEAASPAQFFGHGKVVDRGAYATGYAYWPQVQ